MKKDKKKPKKLTSTQMKALKGGSTSCTVTSKCVGAEGTCGAHTSNFVCSGSAAVSMGVAGSNQAVLLPATTTTTIKK